ncbi:MAG: GNAT family N-acetyltransferase [Actinobacteria bacterium]|nr:GNAT family N-acetyltransferase [Actinomycetota bacterium]
MTVELRPFAEGDLASIAAISTAWNEHFGIPIVDTVELFDEEFIEPLVFREFDICIALVDGCAVGYVYTYHLASETHDQRCYVFARVHPQFLSRGVGTELSAWGARRAEQKLRMGPVVGRKIVRADAPEYDADAQRIFTNLGMTPIRWFAEMRTPLSDVPIVPVPEGVTVIEWDAADDRELRRVKNEAFADHWGSAPDDELRWSQLTTGVATRRDLSLVALDENGVVIGLVLTHRFPDDDIDNGAVVERVGWVHKVATVREWRGRGVASTLISQVVQTYGRAGLTHAGLYVDSDNPTGAVSVYERLGYAVARRSVTYELIID